MLAQLQERPQKVLDRDNRLLSHRKKNNVDKDLTINGFRFAGRGQKPVSRSFLEKLRAQRPGKETKVEAITGRAMGCFSQLKDAIVFAFNLPAIVELGTATGFDFQLIDQADWDVKN
ncbi:efflux RND transporter permease subunit [Escherichia coli]